MKHLVVILMAFQAFQASKALTALGTDVVKTISKEDLIDSLIQSQKENYRLQQELDLSNRRQEAWSREKKELTSTNENLDNENEELAAKLNEAKGAVAYVKHEIDQIEGVFRQQLRGALQELVVSNRRLRACSSENEQLVKTIELLESENEELYSKFHEAKAALAGIQQEIDEIEFLEKLMEAKQSTS